MLGHQKTSASRRPTSTTKLNPTQAATTFYSHTRPDSVMRDAKMGQPCMSATIIAPAVGFAIERSLINWQLTIVNLTL
jgi:hypothetical protein